MEKNVTQDRDYINCWFRAWPEAVTGGECGGEPNRDVTGEGWGVGG